MLEVHPPEHAAHTWRDFLIHIVTIVIGLLIAIGLEQSVEYLHHREQINQAREALDLELRQNILIAQENAILLRREHARYSGNLAALRFIKTHPHTELTDLPAPIQWGANEEPFHVAAWKSIRGGPIAALLPTAELQTNEILYATIDKIQTAHATLFDRVSHASQYRFITSDPRELSPAQLDAEIEATLELLTEHYQASVYLQNLCDNDAALGFKPCLTAAEVHSWKNSGTASDLSKIYGAVGQDRLEREAESEHQLDNLDAQLAALDKHK
jgi:hypothetical protein